MSRIFINVSNQNALKWIIAKKKKGCERHPKKIVLQVSTSRKVIYRVFSENGSSATCVAWDRQKGLIKRLYTERTVFIKPAVFEFTFCKAVCTFFVPSFSQPQQPRQTQP